ncbi:MAG: hypothetical protein ACXW0Z_02015 [Gemmatirosa sp.]
MSIAARLLPSIAALVVLAVGRDARAQGEAVLRDAELPALLAVLRVDIARAGAMERAAPAVARQVETELRTIRTNAEDPLGYVKARTAHFIVPPDARYDTACSRVVSGYIMSPFAVFAIGRTDDATVAALQKKGTTQLSQKEMYELMKQQMGGSAGQAQAATAKWYQARGFRISGTVAESAPLSWGGATKDPIAISVHMTNVAASYGEACARLGNTAVLMLTIDEKVAQKTGFSAAPAKGVDAVRKADDDFDATLARHGVSADRYNALLGALWQAQKELESADEAGQTDAMARIPGMEAMANARRQNRAWLQRHRSDVLPLLEQYARILGGAR